MNTNNPIPPYTDQHINQLQFNCQEDEMDLLELWNILWQGKWFIIGFTFLCTLGAIWYSRSLPEIYYAETLIVPVSKEGSKSGLESFAMQYSGLASLAGINLSSTSDSLETNIAILKSREFLYGFIKENKIMPIIFEGNWDKKKMEWKDKQARPTELNTYNVFKSFLSIDRDITTGLVIIGVYFQDPVLAAKWANALVIKINEHLRTKAIVEAEKSIEFLTDEIERTSIMKMQEILYHLIEKQKQTITLAHVRNEFAFSIIDSAVPPEFKDKPNRKLIMTLGLFTGMFSSIFIIFIFDFVQNLKKRKKLMI